MQLFVFEPKQHECILNPFGLYPQITTCSPDPYLVTGNLVQNSGGDEERVYLAATQETSHVRIGLCILIVRTFLGESNGTPLQDPCLEKPMDRGAWWAAVHGVAKSRTRLTSLSLFTFMHWRRQWQPTPVFLPGESQGRRSLVDCCLWGSTESDTAEAT